MYDSMIYRPAHCPADIPSMLHIERASYPEERQWNSKDFGIVASTPATKLMVVDRSSKTYSSVTNSFITMTDTIGFMVYSYFGNKRIVYQIENLAVLPEFRRQGIATRLIGKLISIGDDLVSSRSPVVSYRIKADTMEDNLGCQLFLRELGFRCTRVHRNYLNDQSAYSFCFKRKARNAC